MVPGAGLLQVGGEAVIDGAEWEALETDEAKRDFARRLLDAMITYGETETAN